MDPVYVILSAAGGLVVGLIGARLLGLGRSAAAEKAAEAEADRIREGARAEVEERKRSAEVDGKEAGLKIKADAEDELRKKRTDLAREAEKVQQRERDLDRLQKENVTREAAISKRERTVEGREKAAESMANKAEQLQDQARKELERLAGVTADEARRRLEDALRDQARAAVAADLKQIADEAESQAAEKAKEIIATAVQRYASEFVQERTVAVVPLPSDDMKGRLIGREGRNIRALEAAAGIDLIIDDTSEAITISCFHPVRREIGRLAIAKLVADGRIHPTRIEELVKKSEKEIEKVSREAGEQAVFDLGLHRVHPELIKMLGTLRFRSSYAQNVLQHSIEVGFLAGLMAAEVGLPVKTARRAGLLHDIGKAVDHEHEGAHGEVGAQVARKFGESPAICQAIQSHEGAGAQSLLDHVVAAANQLSNARPGARRETLASYVKRLEELEKICMGFRGVEKAYALLAGREVHVMVRNDEVDDAQALMLSKDIARKIEDESTYAGSVRVVVLRETRASEYAR